MRHKMNRTSGIHIRAGLPQRLIIPFAVYISGAAGFRIRSCGDGKPVFDKDSGKCHIFLNITHVQFGISVFRSVTDDPLHKGVGRIVQRFGGYGEVISRFYGIDSGRGDIPAFIELHLTIPARRRFQGDLNTAAEMRGEGLIILHTVDFKRGFVILRPGRTGPVLEFIAFVRLCDQNDILAAADRKACLRIAVQFGFAVHIGRASVCRIGDCTDDVFVIDKDGGIGRIRIDSGDIQFAVIDHPAVADDPLFKLVGTVVRGFGREAKRFSFSYEIRRRAAEIVISVETCKTVSGR